MKIYKSIFIIMLLLILSVSAVAAADVNETSHDTLDTSDADVISDGEKTYTNLLDDIKATMGSGSNTLKLQSDYAYNNKTDDDLKTISFNNIENFIIDGNNHRINGNNTGFGFLFKNRTVDVVLKNIVFTNCISPIQIFESRLTTENVTFINTPAHETLGGAVYVDGGNYYSKNDKFTDNYALNKGDSIYGVNSIIEVYNGTFTNKKPVNWALISTFNTDLTVYNCTFANTTSRYATAIFNEGNKKETKIIISNSKFINLHANITAGAIGIKGGDRSSTILTTIENCEFDNVTSEKNGGAVFVDILGGSFGEGTTIINNTKFSKCSSEYGGAVLQLGGYMDLIDSQFTDNYAREDGGAVYTSYTTLYVNNSTFTSNLGSYGSAIYLDKDNLTVEKSTFKDNTATTGAAITTYDSLYIISNSNFIDNSDLDINSYFDNIKSSISGSGNLKTNLNESIDYYSIRINGKPIILNRTTITGSANDTYFNLRDLGLVTPVKNQGSMGSCWAFGIAGAFESAFLIATNTTIDISENNIQDLGLRYSRYGKLESIEGSDYNIGSAYFLDWFGAINTNDDTYDELGKISSQNFGQNAYHIVDAIFVNITDRNALKDALTKYGALDFYIRGASSNEKYYNPNTTSLYVDNPNAPANHYVTLVGWNDTYSRNNFATPAPGDGAWICKNSWGTGWGDNGYFYISYYDQSINRPDVQAVGFIIQNTDNYDYLYQSSVGGYSAYNYNFNEYENTFAGLPDSIISAVGTYFEKANAPYTISIYINETLIYSQNGTSKFSGFNTIKLDQHIVMPYNSTFSVRIKSSSIPVLYLSNTRLVPQVPSYGIKDNETYTLTDAFTPIKVYAVTTNTTTENIIRYYSETAHTYYPISGENNTNVTITFNGTNKTITIKNNTVNIDLGILKVGTYPVTVYANGQIFMSYVIIKPSIDNDGINKITVTTNTQIKTPIKFYDHDGNLIRNTPINAKINGKTIKGAKTDDDGILYIETPENVGTSYIEFTNPLTNEEFTLEVISFDRFESAKNVNMYYYDGSTYKVRVRDDEGNFESAGKIVTIKIDKKTYTVKTDKNGWAILKIPKEITVGSHSIKTTYKGESLTNKLTVKQVLKTSKTVKVKKSAKKLVLSATLKAKSPLKKKTVSFKVNGKTFKAKTNSKGVAKVTLKKSVIKKLKAGKKYTIQISYLKDTVKSTLKVRR